VKISYLENFDWEKFCKFGWDWMGLLGGKHFVEMKMLENWWGNSNVENEGKNFFEMIL